MTPDVGSLLSGLGGTLIGCGLMSGAALVSWRWMVGEIARLKTKELAELAAAAEDAKRRLGDRERACACNEQRLKALEEQSTRHNPDAIATRLDSINGMQLKMDVKLDRISDETIRQREVIAQHGARLDGIHRKISDHARDREVHHG